MMAYMRDTMHTCNWSGCGKDARYEVLNWRNSSYGRFCKRHGQMTVNRLNQEEKEEKEKLTGKNQS